MLSERGSPIVEWLDLVAVALGSDRALADVEHPLGERPLEAGRCPAGFGVYDGALVLWQARIEVASLIPAEAVIGGSERLLRLLSGGGLGLRLGAGA